MKDLDVIEAHLSRMLNFFPRVDARVAGLFTVNSAILVISAANVQAGDLKEWYIAVPVAFLTLGLIASYTFLYRCNFPDLNDDASSLIYFAAIQARTESAFIGEYEGTTDDAYRADMLRQIWRNSAILSEKYRALAVAIRSTLATLLPFAIFLAMTAVEHSRMPLLKG